MKNILTVILIICSFHAHSQMAVTAPNLEVMASSNLSLQSKTLMESVQSQINTLNTAKNTLDNLEKIKEIDERITKVSNTLKQARVIYNIFSLGTDVLNNATYTGNLLTKNNTGANKKIADKYLNQLQTAVDEADNIVSVCKDIISENYKMNDYERLKLLNEYYDGMKKANSRISILNRSFRNVMAINKL